ncbi:hypothetical protein PROPHIGD11-1_16 [Mycobacterium phage prophiGD11-1]|nr:hypothetical protein PROPHIGD11-1_16 [Mycobacterium phage prophiGD11-1]
MSASSCIVCFQGTDTALAFYGSPEWCVAGLMTLGVPGDQAMATFESCHPNPSDPMTVTYRVCSSCVERAGCLPEPKLTIPGFEIPAVYQPGMTA